MFKNISTLALVLATIQRIEGHHEDDHAGNAYAPTTEPPTYVAGENNEDAYAPATTAPKKAPIMYTDVADENTDAYVDQAGENLDCDDDVKAKSEPCPEDGYAIAGTDVDTSDPTKEKIPALAPAAAGGLDTISADTLSGGGLDKNEALYSGDSSSASSLSASIAAVLMGASIFFL